MKSLNIYNEKDLSSMTLKEITEYNNKLANIDGITPTKRFSSKPKAIKKTLQNVSIYNEKLAEQNKKTNVPAKKSTFDMEAKIKTVKCKGTEGTIEHSICDAISSGCDTVQKVVDKVIKTHIRPRSGNAVDYQYVIHNIKWFTNIGHLKLG